MRGKIYSQSDLREKLRLSVREHVLVCVRVQLHADTRKYKTEWTAIVRGIECSRRRGQSSAQIIRKLANVGTYKLKKAKVILKTTQSLK